MRKLIYILLFFNSVIFAQTNGITYQAVIYYPNGQNVPGVNIQNSPMANKPICLQFSLLDNLSQLEYQETIQTSTDAYGMVNLVIGSGNQTAGYASSFNAVVWNTTTKSLKVQLDASGSCQQFILLSDKPLSSVPFAYASVTANNVSGIVSLQNGGTGATTPSNARINLGLGNVDNTSDLNKPISTATQTALNAKENTSNKSTTTTLGTSDVLYPTQNAVKTYVDTQVAAATIPDATSTTKGKIQLAGDLGGTAASPTVPGLATKENTITAGTTSQYYRGDKTWQTLDKSAVGLNNVDNTSDLNKPISTATQTALNAKENTSNKSTTTTLGTSDVLYPTQNAVKTYVDTQVAAATIPDATSTTKGKIQLAGDLGGTAASPTVPGLATKENTITAGTTSQYYRGDKTWQTLDKSAVGLNNVDNTSDLNKPISTATQTALNAKENTSNKSTTTTLGTSDVLYPTQNAVKTYVDTQVAAATIPDATSTTKGKIQLAGDLGGTAASPTVPGLATKENTITAGTTSQYYRGDKTWQTLDKSAVGLNNVDNTSDLNKPISTATQTALNAKENTSNKSTTTTLGTSDVLYPTQNAVKTYVDTQVAAATIPDATSTTKGKIQLAGDLGGTAASPTVPGLATKENTITAGTTSQYYRGDKTWQTLDKSAVGLNNVDNTSDLNKPISTATQTALNAKENTSNKSTDVSVDGASDVKYPSVKATKDYVDSQIAAGVVDADSSTKGKVQLAGDLSGTAASPAVATGAITTAKLANDAVTSAKITDGTIVVGDLADNAVETAKIKNANITNAKLDKANIPLSGFGAATADVDLGSNKMTNVTDPISVQDAATKNYVDTTIASNVTPDATTTVKGKVQLAGDLSGTAASPAVATGAITTAKLANDAVTSAKITDGTIVVGDLADNAVETAKIKNANITNAKLDKANIPLSGFGAATADVDLGSNKMTNVTDPISAQDAATKNYVDTTIASNVTPDATTTVKGKVQLAGDLSGTAASPAVATGAITTAKLANDAVTSAKITDGTIVVGDLADNAVETAKIKNANITNAKLDKANIPLSGFGAATADVDLGSNKMTNVTDPISAQDAATKNYVDTTIASNVTPDATTTVKGKVQLAGDLSGTAASPAVATGAITTAKLANDAVTSAKITDGTIVVGDLADNAVETAKIKNANVTNAKLDKANIPLSGFGAATADVDLGSNKMTNVTDPISAQDAATKNYVDTTIASNVTPDATTTVKGKVQLAGDLSGTAASPAVATGAITTAKLANDAVTSAKITDGTIVVGDLADNAVETAKIKNANVTNAKLDKANIPLSGFGAATADVDLGSNKLTNVTDPISAQDAATKNYVDTTIASNVTPDATTTVKGKVQLAGDLSGTAASPAVATGAITTAKLANDAVTSAKITDGTIVVGDLADNAVETAKIKDAAVTTAKIADANITYAKIQNVSATDKVLGRVSTGAGVIEEISTTGTGNVVRATSPTLVTPVIGAATGTSLSVSGQLISTVATGTAPLVVTSTTPVANLNIGGNSANVTGIVAIANGGTGATTKTAAFDALSPMTTAGDIIYGGTSGTGTRLAAGTNGQVLTLASGVPSWVTPSGITTLAAIGSTANANGATISGSTLNLQPASANFGGVVTTGAQTFAGAKTFSSDLNVNGLTVGRGNTGDETNTALGGSVLQANTAGTDNTAVGYFALKTTTGSLNSAFGSLALKTNTSGSRNAAFGTMAIQANSTGNNNSGFGYGTLYATTASDNTGIGYLAGYNVTSGAKNIFIGSLAGNSISTASTANTTGLNSVMIGYDVRPLANGDTNEIVLSGYNGTAGTVGLGSNTTTIGNSATTRAVIYGSTSLSNLPATAASGNGGDFTLEAQDGFTTGNTNGGNINLTPGTANGSGTAGIVKVNGQIQITGGNPGAGEVLVSDANGLASWSNAVGTTVVTNSTTYAITTAEAFVFYNGSANAAFTIPAASSTNQGKAITIKNKTGFGITITPASGTIYIDNANTGAANVSIGIEASNNWIKLVSDGTQWNVLRALF